MSTDKTARVIITCYDINVRLKKIFVKYSRVEASAATSMSSAFERIQAFKTFT